MHRAEKASSKICREREVEKAQELHRRKIDGVKSYLTAITRPAAPSVPLTKRPSTFFRRGGQHQQQTADTTLTSHHSGHLASGSASSTALSGYSEPDEEEDDDDDGGEATSEYEDVDGGGSEATFVQSQAATQSTTKPKPKNFDKLEELRSVLVPVMEYTGSSLDDRAGDLDYERYLDEITNSGHAADEAHVREPEPVKLHMSSQSLHASAFRLRRLKQIKTDNVTLFDRIKNSAAHYRTDRFKKEWDQNVAYLASICEFPVINETIHPPPPRRHTRKRSPFASRPAEPLPSIQHVVPAAVHPIKAIPTSPRKPKQLNLSPAFRSLRKGLPQAPGLPPLTASPRAVLTLKSKQSMTAMAGSRSGFQFDDTANLEASGSPPSPEARSPSPTHTTPDPVVDDPMRYTLLKIGRFVGGKYLVLTVFCGDGVTNPYGFDVVALDPENHLEFRLSITKETTHLLLDTISSSSMAERTAAAAGTNLSMELIARCICDHVRYASLGSCEMVFLVATVGTRGGLNADTVDTTEDETMPRSSQVSVGDNPSLLLDSAYSALALSLHQRCCIRSDGTIERHVHVFASTRPQQCCEASMVSDAATGSSCSNSAEPLIDINGAEYLGLVCYELYDVDSHGSLHSVVSARLQLSVSALLHHLEAERVEVDHDPRARLSFDRLVMLSLPFLHLHHEATTQAKLVLDLSNQNNWQSGTGSASPCRPSTTVLPRTLSSLHRASSHSRLRLSTGKPLPHQRHDAGSPLSPLPPSIDDLKAVLQTGMLWRGAFLLARVSLLCPTRIHQENGQRVRDPRDELLVFNVFNSSTGSYAERILDGDQVEGFSQKLGAWQSDSSNFLSPLIVFAKHLLLRMRLEVDLRGQEIIQFPTLEPRFLSASGRGSSSPGQRLSPNKLPVKMMIQDDDPFPPARDDDDEDEGDEAASYEDDEDLEAEAATTIQALGRGFLLRLHQRRIRQPEPLVEPRRSEEYSRNEVFYSSLSPEQHKFVKNRAAKRILVACRSFVDRTRRRKRALVDFGGLTAKTPRSLTPTVPVKPRGGSSSIPHHSRVSQPSLGSTEAISVDCGLDITSEASAPVHQQSDSQAEAEEDQDDDSEDGEDVDVPPRHVNTLGALEEEEPEDSKAASLVGIDPIGERAVDRRDTTNRAGRKAMGHFVLERWSSDALDPQQTNVLETRIMGTLGEFLRSS